MWKYFEPIAWLVWFFFFLAIDAVLYYSYGTNHSPVPAIVCGAATLVVGFFAVMAIYETFKHRNDKETW